MLDMGFLPDIKRILKHVPAKRQTLFFSATMPAPIMTLVREMLKDPVLINLERQSKPAVGITQALYPVAQELKSTLLLTLLQRGEMQEVLVFTRTKHRANRLHAFLTQARHSGGTDPRQPLAGAAHRGARRLQEGEVPRPRRDRHRRARHRHRGARSRRELRRPVGARGLHPPDRPHGARRGDRRCLHLRGAGRRERAAPDREACSASGCRA